MGVLDVVVQDAQAELGKPYVYGASGPTAFDCSGLVQYVYRKAGISVPRTSEQQQTFAVQTSNPVPGDLVFWGNPAYHVGIYAGNGKVLDAPHTGTVVQVQDIWGNPTYGHVAAAGSGGGVTTPGSAPGSIGASVQSFATEGIFVAAGLGLIGYGLWRTGVPQKVGKGVAGGVTKVGMAL